MFMRVIYLIASLTAFVSLGMFWITGREISSLLISAWGLFFGAIMLHDALFDNSLKKNKK